MNRFSGMVVLVGVVSLSGCKGNGLPTCDEEGKLTPSTQCNCGSGYKSITHPCCTGPFRVDTTDCQLPNGEWVEASALPKDEPSPPDEATEQPNGILYVDIEGLRTDNFLNKSNVEFSVLWDYVNRNSGILYPPEAYDDYKLGRIDPPAMTVNTEPITKVLVPWGQLGPGENEPMSVPLTLDAGAYNVQVINVPLRTLGTDSISLWID